MTQLKVYFDSKGEAVFTAGKFLKGKKISCFCVKRNKIYFQELLSFNLMNREK